MRRLKNAIYRFMYGRYGTDALNKALLWAYAGLVLAYMIVFLFVEENAFVYLAYLFVSWALVGIIFFRMMSKNISKRRSENEKFEGFFKLIRNKHRDRKTHVYKKCPKCGAVLRLPKRKGTNIASCPRCANKFEVKG